MKTRTPILLFLLLSLSFHSIKAQTSDSYNNLAKDAYDNKNYDLCVEYCNKSISIAPNGWAYWERGNAYYDLIKYELAASDYTSAVTYYSSGLQQPG